jgi:disulfide bond formation protein DsbB
MNAKVLALIGAVMLVAGLIVGFIPVSSGGSGCGSAFAASSDAHVSDLVNAMSGRESSIREQCESLHSILAIPAWILLGIGALLLVVSLAFAGKKESQEAGSAR